MKVLIIGADGFVGSNIVKTLEQKHEVLKAGRDFGGEKGGYQLDLREKPSIRRVLEQTRPEVVINAAGVVENSELAALNVLFTTNLLECIVESDNKPNKIIICGSAAEYGIVNVDELPVTEDAHLRATNLYGKSKIQEEKVALNFKNHHDLPIIVARIFNPIGPGMHEKFLVSRVLSQINEVSRSERNAIEISRADASRDYIVISDLVAGIKAIVEGEPKHSVYNIGSGKSTSNGKIVELLLRNVLPNQKILVVETQTEPEPLFAIQADISRMERDFNWKPVKTLEETIKEIVDATK